MPSKSKPVDSWTETQTKTVYEVVAERLTGQSISRFTSTAMQWGIDTEAEARKVYEIETGYSVEQVGFVAYGAWVGCSPDGLVYDDGMVEIKCPNSDTHLMYRTIPGKLRDAYYWQVMGQLWITGRKWCDLISFDPRFLELNDQLFIERIQRDEKAIALLSARLESAVAMAETIQGGR